MAEVVKYLDTLDKSRKETNHNLASFNSATLVENGIQGWPSQQKDHSHKRITDIGKKYYCLSLFMLLQQKYYWLCGNESPHRTSASKDYSGMQIKQNG